MLLDELQPVARILDQLTPLHGPDAPALRATFVDKLRRLSVLVATLLRVVVKLVGDDPEYRSRLPPGVLLMSRGEERVLDHEDKAGLGRLCPNPRDGAASFLRT